MRLKEGGSAPKPSSPMLVSSNGHLFRPSLYSESKTPSRRPTLNKKAPSSENRLAGRALVPTGVRTRKYFYAFLSGQC